MTDLLTPEEDEAGERRNSEFTVQDFLMPAWAKRRRILIISFVIGIVTWGVNFLFHDYYRTTATILPAPEKGRLSALGQFAEVAALAGVNVPGSEVSRLYPSIVSSETVLRNAILDSYQTQEFPTPVNLIQYFEYDEPTQAENMDKALNALQKVLTTSFDARTGVVTITLVMDEPQLAAEVLNRIVDELDKFMREKKMSNASEQVRWIETRLQQVEDSLRQSENALKSFREKNRRVVDSPELLVQEGRLTRNVQVNSAVFIELKKQYELAKLEEIKNMTIVNVLDSARAPVKKIGPKRKTNAIIAFIVALFGMSGYYAVRRVHGSKITSWISMFRSARAGT